MADKTKKMRAIEMKISQRRDVTQAVDIPLAMVHAPIRAGLSFISGYNEVKYSIINGVTWVRLVIREEKNG